MWTVYFLQLVNYDIYIGSTNNIKRRLSEHHAGLVISTSKFLPLKLLAYICVPTKNKAIELEQYFKSGSGKAILKKRIINIGSYISI